MQSRLSRTTERKTKTQLLLFLGGIIVVIFLLFKFGIPALTNLSLYLSSKNTSGQDTTNTTSVIAPPTLNEPYTATNSATITVSGTGVAHETIQLFVNSTQVDSSSTKDDGTFSFTGVNLTQQQNT